MVEFYLNDKDKEIYKKTDYLCNEKEKLCICNTHADDFRKIYDGINYKQNIKYISWCKNIKINFNYSFIIFTVLNMQTCKIVINVMIN